MHACVMFIEDCQVDICQYAQSAALKALRKKKCPEKDDASSNGAEEGQAPVASPQAAAAAG